MDTSQGPHVSPDGRHRWDAAAQRWVPVEAATPGWATPPAAPAPTSQPPSPGVEAAGGWGRPAATPPSRAGSTLPGWNRASQPQPWGSPTPPQAPWAAPPAPWSTSRFKPAERAAAGPAPAAVGGVAAAVGGIGLVIGAFLAWISASANGVSTSQSGINTPSGDGWFFVVCGLAVVAAAVAAIAVPKSWLGLMVVAGALAAAGLTIYEFTDVHGHIVDARAALGRDVGSYGVGLYLLLIGSALALLGGIGEAARGRGR